MHNESVGRAIEVVFDFGSASLDCTYNLLLGITLMVRHVEIYHQEMS